MPAWSPTNNHLGRLAAAPKHDLVDRALAARLVGVNADSLLQGRGPMLLPHDGTYLGSLFESLTALSLRVFAQAAEAKVSHFRDRSPAAVVVAASMAATWWQWSRRQVFDVPEPRVHVTEHQAQRVVCACGCETTAGFPAEATAPAVYGPRIKAYAVYLMVRQHVPFERCAEALADLFGVQVATGTLDRWLTETATALAGFIARARILLRAAAVVHVDETGARVKRAKVWFHLVASTLLTLYWCDQSRGKPGLDATGVLDTYTGTAVHDRYRPYFDYRCTHALCGAHLIRNLASVAEVHSQKLWAEATIELLIEMKNTVEATIAEGGTALSRYRRRKYRQRWNQIVDQALTANPDPPPGRKRNTLQRES